MGLLTTAALDEILGAGCPCGSHKLEFTTYVDGRFTMLDGEQFGALVWAYKGETFVDGGFEACPESQHEQKWRENAAEHDGFLLLLW